MFVDPVEQWAAFCTIGRMTKVLLLLTGFALLAHGTYYHIRSRQIIGGVLALFPTTLHYSLVTLFALTASAESLELIAYMPLAQIERWQETQEIIVKSLKCLGLFALCTGIWGLWQYYYQAVQRLRIIDCLLLSGCGFVFIYFVEITNCISRMIDKIS